MAWIEEELGRVKSVAGRELLEKSRQITGACAARIVPFANEYGLIANRFAKHLADINSDSQEALEEFERMRRQFPTDLPDLIKRLALEGEDARTTQLKIAIFTQELISNNMELLLGTLLVILRDTSDSSWGRDFFKELEVGATDLVVGAFLDEIFFHGAASMILVVRAAQAAFEASRKRGDNADAYLAAIEKYNAACLQWAKTMDSYLAGLTIIMPFAVQPENA